MLVGAAATRRCELLLGAARLNAGEREDGAGEREERVREDGLPASAAIDGADSGAGAVLAGEARSGPRCADMSILGPRGEHC